jgi:hypothetical protein
MWYPPTGSRLSFSAEFADRFEHGLLWWSTRGGRTPRTSCGNSGTAGRFERLATRTKER